MKRIFFLIFLINNIVLFDSLETHIQKRMTVQDIDNEKVETHEELIYLKQK